MLETERNLASLKFETIWDLDETVSPFRVTILLLKLTNDIPQ